MTKSLSKAIALATALGATASAHAVNVNPEGLGQVLLYSLYTTEAGKDTSVSVTNTTDEYKAVKVRFVEAMNSAEVLDFNLYLSPRDQWSATIVKNENGAELVTSDTSCTAPLLTNGSDTNKFKNFAYAAFTTGVNGKPLPTPIAGDGGWQELARTRVGHLEMIEMGTITDPAVQAMIKHVNGVPGNCDALRSRFTAAGAVWKEGSSAYNIADAIGPQTGGLYGTASIIDPVNATLIGYDATAVDNFYDTDLVNPTGGSKGDHAQPGTVLPNLNSPKASVFATFKNGDTAEYAQPIDAVSAVLMKKTIENDYLAADSLKGETNWVVTFPTKRNYVYGDSSAVVIDAGAPFTNVWEGATGACEALNYAYWDHEEGEPTPEEIEDSPLLPSPLPPMGVEVPVGSALCYETNIVKINGKDVLGGERPAGYGHLNLNLPAAFEKGWLQFSFNNPANSLVSEDPVAVVTDGLPVIGFSAVTVQNGFTGQAGAIANFGTAFQHKATTSHDIVE